MPHELPLLDKVAKAQAQMSDFQWTLEITTKGGPGSGNWRHTGLAGVHGGADPGGGLGKVAAWRDDQYRKADFTAKTWYAEWNTSLRSAEVNALVWYKDSGFDWINDSLRTGELVQGGHDDDRVQNRTRLMDGALERARLPFTTITHRGMCSSADCIEEYGQLQPGDEFTDHAFVSSSLLPRGRGAASDDLIQVHITVPKGSKAAGASDRSLVIGATNAAPVTGKLDGKVDELRISDIERSAAWIGTCHNNQNDPSSFITVGSEEAA